MKARHYNYLITGIFFFALICCTLKGRAQSAIDYYNSGYKKGFIDNNDMVGAISDLTKAIELNPDFWQAYLNRGRVKIVIGDLSGAINDETKAIELKPDDMSAYYIRGNAKYTKNDLDGAIADYNKAIELKPDDTGEAYNNRGLAKKAKGDLDGAIADFNKAIELKPDMEEPYYNRGRVKKAKGDLNGAITDYNKAIELKPDFVQAYDNRGCLRYNLHSFTDALIDFRMAIKLDSPNIYAEYVRFRIWLIRARLGEAQFATMELQKYLDSRTIGQPGDWSSKVGHFLTGQLSEPEFLASAKNSDQKTEAGQLCEAYFYAGSKNLFVGNKITATDYFQKSIATNEKDFTEYTSAAAELKFLKANTTKPIGKQ